MCVLVKYTNVNVGNNVVRVLSLDFTFLGKTHIHV